MKREYTEKLHASRLIAMLKKPEPCLYCPAPYGYRQKSGRFILSDKDYVFNQPPHCGVCQKFVGVHALNSDDCPCIVLGREEAIRRTWQVLEEKGYI